MNRLIVSAAVVVLLGAATACGDSGGGGGGGASPASTSSTSTKPAHDLRVNAELEQYVTDEWNKNFADPADANYAAGVTVKSVQCVPQTGTTTSVCTITPSSGVAKKFGYIVAEDGTSAERSEAPG